MSFIRFSSLPERLSPTRVCKDENGAFLLEAMFVLGLFLGTMAFFLWSLVIVYDQLATQYSLDRAIRIESVAGVASATQRALRIQNGIMQSGDLFSLRIQSADITMCPLFSTSCPVGQLTVGGANDWVRVTVRRRYFLPILGIPLETRQSVLTRNESRL